MAMETPPFVDDFPISMHILPSGDLTVRHGTSPFLIGKPSISMGHFPWLR